MPGVHVGAFATLHGREVGRVMRGGESGKVGKLAGGVAGCMTMCTFLVPSLVRLGSASPLLWLSPYSPDLHISTNYRIKYKKIEIESHAGGGRGRNSRVVSCVIATLPPMF